LAARFAEVTLNDIEQKLLDAAFSSPDIHAQDRRKIRLHAADLSGMTVVALEGIETAVASSTDVPAAIEAMAAALETAQPNPFPIAGSFDLLVASCLLSQLHFALVHEATLRFEARFPGQVAMLQQSDRWKNALYKTARRMEDKFIDDLATIMAPGGLVYLSESVQMCYVTLAAGSQWQSEGTYRMLRTTDLADYVGRRFTIVERARWEWVVSPPMNPGETGRLYDVQALVLRPR
jgi:hypothetical protein